VTADVLLPECGNGVREDGEACDDGNGTDGDGCAACAVEPCWTCDEGEPSKCGPLDCDDHVSCTIDRCDAPTGCRNMPDHGACGACEACSATDGCMVGPRSRGSGTVHWCFASHRRTSRLLVQSASGKRNGRLRWRWGAGEKVPPGAVGDPTRTTTYDICMFGPDGDLMFRATAPAAASCDGRPCWTRRRSAFRYRDPNGTRNGLSSLRAAAGAHPAFAFTARGAALELPQLPLALPVVVELQADHALCWSGVFRDRRGQHNDTVRFTGSGN
jgi:cysteine-rich repeat protein